MREGLSAGGMNSVVNGASNQQPFFVRIIPFMINRSQFAFLHVRSLSTWSFGAASGIPLDHFVGPNRI